MSDRTHQALNSLKDEVRAIAVEHLALCRRLNQSNPDLVSDSDVSAAAQRLDRLTTMFKGLQQQPKDG